tara:strand:- start:416065 stop:417417 length:1353 start_codon:yes stop_codon:yes gene_type:complete
MTLKNCIIFFFCCFLANSTVAQKAWTLDECIDYAIAHNLELNDFKYTNNASKEAYKQSVRDLLPNLMGYSDYNIRYGRSINPNTNDIINTDFFSNNYSLSSSVAIFKGFQKVNTIKASKLLYKAAQEDVLQQKYMLAFRVMSAFYDIRFFEGLVTISEEQLLASQTSYDLVKRQVDIGLKAGADLYEAESVLLTDQLVVTQNKNSLEAAQLKLIQEMNLEGETSIQINNALDELTQVSTESQTLHQDSIFKTANAFIPLIKSETFRAEAAKKDVAIARGDLYPSLTLSSGYSTGYYETNVDDLGGIIPYKTQINDNISKFVGVSLNIPIFNRWSSRSNIKQNKIALNRATNNLNIKKQELYKLIQQLVQDKKAFVVESEQSTKKMKAQELTFSIAQKKYEKGMISAIELYQAKNLFATSQNENLQVKLQLKITEKTIDFYKGLPIFNIKK